MVIPENTRPHLGLKIVSPEKSEPIKVLEKTLNTTFTKQETQDIKQLLSTTSTKSTSDLKALLKKHLEHRVSKEHEQTVNLESDFVTSILEATTHFSEVTFNKSPVKTISKIPILSPRNENKENMRPKPNSDYKFKVPTMGTKSRLPVSKEKLLKVPPQVR